MAACLAGEKLPQPLLGLPTLAHAPTIPVNIQIILLAVAFAPAIQANLHICHTSLKAFTLNLETFSTHESPARVSSSSTMFSSLPFSSLMSSSSSSRSESTSQHSQEYLSFQYSLSSRP